MKKRFEDQLKVYWVFGMNEIITNADYIKTLDNKKFAEWVLYNAPKLGRSYTHSYIGLTEWLEKPYNKDEWVWSVMA